MNMHINVFLVSPGNIGICVTMDDTNFPNNYSRQYPWKQRNRPSYLGKAVGGLQPNMERRVFLYMCVEQMETGQCFAVMASGGPVLVNSCSTGPGQILFRHSGVYRKYLLDYACMDTYAYHCPLSFPPVQSLCYNIV